ncbi:MAG: hypothetical protein K9W44_01715 [Candidatus Lokiarchaeota archaeon]|nr:hypothetical protein [Candidatus Harpocratesius repetitus]
MVSIIFYEDLNPKLKDSISFFDLYYSKPFWKNCAEYQNENMIHSLYCIVSDDNSEIYSFFSLRVNNYKVPFDGEKNFHLPIIDLSFLGFNKDLEFESIKNLLLAILDYIEELALEFSNKVGIRFIRCYILYNVNHFDNKSLGTPIINGLKEVFEEAGYEDWKDLKINKRTRPIIEKATNSKKLVLLYMMKNLKFI